MKISNVSAHSALLLALGSFPPGGEPSPIKETEPAGTKLENGSFQAELNGFLISD